MIQAKEHAKEMQMLKRVQMMELENYIDWKSNHDADIFGSAFSLIDDDNSGSVDASEVLRTLHQLGMQVRSARLCTRTFEESHSQWCSARLWTCEY